MYRFSDISGKLNDSKFQQSYKFLEEHQEAEVQRIEDFLKKNRSPEAAHDLKEQLTK